MATPYTPDPTNGAILYGIGTVQLPIDNDPPRGAIVRAPCENIIDILWYLTTGPANDADYKITGNGVPPATGYTPTTNPIIIKGTGIKLDSAPIVRIGNGATSITRSAAIDPSSVLETLDVSADCWYVDDPTWLVNVDYVVANAGGSAADMTMRIVARGLTGGGTIRIRRSAPPGGAIIANISGSGMGWVDLRKLGSSWRLEAFGGDATVTTGVP